MWGSIISAGIGAAGSLLGTSMHNDAAKDAVNASNDFQREVYQNQYQWKVADAKKAGLHPLAVLGGGAYSASPSSVPIRDPGDLGLGALGESIGDAFTAYLNRDQLKEMQDRARYKDDLLVKQGEANLRKTEAETNESIARALSYSRPMATGREYMPGQTDSGSPPLRVDSPGSSVVIRAIPSVDGSSLGPTAYDINMHPDRMQELGDEWGQVKGMLEKAARENREYFFDPETGREFRYSRADGVWYLMPKGGGGGV